jgi:hypothetical protein
MVKGEGPGSGFEASQSLATDQVTKVELTLVGCISVLSMERDSAHSPPPPLARLMGLSTPDEYNPLHLPVVENSPAKTEVWMECEAARVYDVSPVD